MPWIVPALIIGLPLLEIYTFVRVAGAIGFLPAIGAAVLAGIIGLALLRHQGFSTLMRARSTLDRGELPVEAALDGLILAVAGGLLLLPGFLSDVAALLLLLPPVRAALKGWLAPRAMRPAGGPTVIDGDFTIVDGDAPVQRPRLPPDRGPYDPQG